MNFFLRAGNSLLALWFAGILVALAGCSAEQGPETVADSARAAKVKQCVEPTEVIRRNHMELIKHQRDATVHQGIRATQHSLVGCVDCHVQLDRQGKPVPVNAQNQFCDACHDKVGTELTCFACHSPVPNGPAPATATGLALEPGVSPRPALALIPTDATKGN